MNGHDAVEVVPMVLEDIPRVLEIDQLSFPLPWSATSYRYELTQNPNSHFWVAVGAAGKPDGAKPAGAPNTSGVFGWLAPSRWFRAPEAPALARSVVGYSGFWFILDEVHISTIAVHPDWRGRRVGEQLFVSMMEQALELSAVTATLEVRVTNDRAQNLYRKYHFEIVGRRKHYYRDNGEDALLMTAELGSGYRDDMRRLFAEKRPGPSGTGERK
jgi:[ribosomal protein S18]-alanine N-acetyltransferase